MTSLFFFLLFSLIYLGRGGESRAYPTPDYWMQGDARCRIEKAQSLSATRQSLINALWLALLPPGDIRASLFPVEDLFKLKV